MTRAASAFTGLKAIAQAINTHVDNPAQICLQRIREWLPQDFVITAERQKPAFPE
jgi:hypothetical protein